MTLIKTQKLSIYYILPTGKLEIALFSLNQVRCAVEAAEDIIFQSGTVANFLFILQESSWVLFSSLTFLNKITSTARLYS